MSKKPKVQYNLSDPELLSTPSDEDIKSVLRAADEIIYMAGRTMLAKILKGSKDKKVLELKLDECPSYGYYHHLSILEITKIIDWLIVEDYLTIKYNGRLPMIIFSSKGWESYKPIYADELFHKILTYKQGTDIDLIEELKQINREVIYLLLGAIGESKNIGFIRFLIKWQGVEVKKVRAMINITLSKLKAI